MRTTFLNRMFIGGELHGTRQQWACVFESMHPFNKSLAIPSFGSRPLVVKPLHSEIDRTEMPWSAFKFEPGTILHTAGKETFEFPAHSFDLGSPRLGKSRFKRECKRPVQAQGVLQSPHHVFGAT